MEKSRSSSPDFSQSSRPVKRELSCYEKSTLLSNTGRALILPAHPDTEIEELNKIAGYDLSQIVGVESDPRRYEALAEYYGDAVHLRCEDVISTMAQTRIPGSYSYIHLDFCGHLTANVTQTIQAWKSLPAPVCRVRVTSFHGRRTPIQVARDQAVTDGLLLNWCEAARDKDQTNPARWEEYHNWFLDQSNDLTYSLAAIMIANFLFGISQWSAYANSVKRSGVYLPSVTGTHRVTNLTRYKYFDRNSAQRGSSHMTTVWADLITLEDKVPDTPTILEYLAESLSALAGSNTPSYNPIVEA